MTTGELLVLAFWGSCMLVSWLAFNHGGLLATAMLLAGFSLIAMRREDENAG